MKKCLIIILFLLSCAMPQGRCQSCDNEYVNAVPIDFSYVGYRHGEADIPLFRSVLTLNPPADGSDATEMIQNALDNVPAPGAVFLKAGDYNIEGALAIERSGVVLRGEGESTRLIATGTVRRPLIKFGVRTERKTIFQTKIVEDAFAGQMWVKVDDPDLFAAGDRVALFFEPNDCWVADLKMNRIQDPKGKTRQWIASEFAMYWEREVTAVEGNVIWLDCPIVSDFESRYAEKMELCGISVERIEESGIEDIFLLTEYDRNNPEDEEHSMTAIYVRGAENCWIRGVKSAHFGSSFVTLAKWARCITVRDCISTAPISQITGMRRYAFNINGGQMCLIENCVADEDRHGFVTGARVPGPNVFLDCVMTNAHSVVGPHHRWATGLLYDSCQCGIRLEVNDRADWGSGHGWPAVNCVFWNCVSDKIDCMSPWIGGRNWCIGSLGQKYQKRTYMDGLERPDGVWMSPGQHVEPGSLYRHQLNRRLGRRPDSVSASTEPCVL